ncbi:protein kinase family protein [Psychrobacillus sp. FSL H8-0484]|uniref:protein kinase family protein n=1 Tax=Psychrobacillus sp. FSL H8-0484 TaxID=2921390 RepID=UPI0030F98D25
MVDSYQKLASTVIINKKNRLISYDESLNLIGAGRSAFVFKLKKTNKAMKVFFSNFEHLAKIEGEIYDALQTIHYYPSVYKLGSNYIVMDYIDGQTLFECLTNGKLITSVHINEIDYALSLASERGLNPSDIHLKNIIITSNGEIRIIDVARFRQTKDCMQWTHLKKSYHQLYRKRFFPQKIPVFSLNILAFLYKKSLIPTYRG